MRQSESSQILKEVYMGCHPLADYDPIGKNIDREAMEQYIPRYFQQRLTLNHLYT